MELLNTNNLFIKDNGVQTFYIELKDDIGINIKDNLKSELYLLVNSITNKEITIDIGENSNVKLVFSAYGNSSYNLIINIARDSFLDLYTSDSFDSDAIVNKTINLNEVNASYKGYEYLASNYNKIDGKFVVNHNAAFTTAKGKFVYLSKNNGYINRDVISKIDKGMNDSNSSENIKGVILDKTSRIDAKPILIIDFDDVHASHGCAIGTIDENEIYYLMSRGLSKDDALKIICKSLINPIYKAINEEEFLNKIKPMLDSSITGE